MLVRVKKTTTAQTLDLLIYTNRALAAIGSRSRLITWKRPYRREEDFEVISRDLLAFPPPSCIIALREGHTNIALCCCTTDTEQHSPSPSWASIAATTCLVVVARRRVQKSRRHSTRRFITDHPFRALAPKSDLSALRNKRFASRDILE